MRKVLLAISLLLALPCAAQVNVSGSQIQIGGTTSGVTSLTTNNKGGLSTVSAGVLNVPAYPQGNVYSPPNFSSLVGAFTDSSGNVILPVALGNGPTTFYVPQGATQLQLGINDSDLSDTSGSWVVKVNGTNYTVGAKSAPWLTTGGINSRYPIAIPAATGTAVTTIGAVGTAVTVQYVSGTISNGAVCGGSGSGPWDASGQAGCTYDYVPAEPGYWTVAAVGGGAVSSVSNSDGSLTITPTTGAVVGSINYAHAGTWTALMTFNAGLSIPSGQGVTQTTGGSTSNCWNTSGSTTACGASGVLPSGVKGQVPTNDGTGANNYPAQSPTIGVANGGASITTAYTLLCDSAVVGTGIQDRGRWAIVGTSGSVVLPDLAGTGCSGMFGGVLNSTTGSVTVSRQTSDTLNCYVPGSAPLTAQTSCTIPEGSWALFSPNVISATAYDVKVLAAGSSGGGLTGQTTNYVPKATSATASTTSSIIEDQGTDVVIHSTGTSFGASIPEGTAIAPATGQDIYYADSVSHLLKLSTNGGIASPICTASNGQCASSVVPVWKRYTFVADSTGTSVTSPSMSVTTGDILIVSCRYGVGTSGTATDSASNTYASAVNHQQSSSLGDQVSIATASTTASITFTCTQASSAAGLSLVAMDFGTAGSTVDITASGNGVGSPSFVTTQRDLIIYCTAIGALTSYPLTNIGVGWNSAGVSQSTVGATNADQGCAWMVSTGLISGGANPFTPGATTNAMNVVAAFKF